MAYPNCSTWFIRRTTSFIVVQVAEADFGGDPALVADVDQGLADGRPVDLSLAELVVEPLGLGVFLDVDLEDPLAQLANPLLGIAVLDDVADVEVGADRRGCRTRRCSGRTRPG